jgi:outer membrane immunogenic protein
VKNDSFNSAPLPPPPSLVVPRSNNFSFSPPYARLGIEAGMNVQEGFLVYGVEADALWSPYGASGTETKYPTAANLAAYPGYTYVPVSLTAKENPAFLGTVRLRVGVTPINRLLIFASVGPAFSSDSLGATVQPVGPYSAVGATRNFFDVGIAFGAGAEYAVTNNVSIKGEYIQTSTEPDSVYFPSEPVSQRIFKFSTQNQSARFGVNYHF